MRERSMLFLSLLIVFLTLSCSFLSLNGVLGYEKIPLDAPLFKDKIGELNKFYASEKNFSRKQDFKMLISTIQWPEEDFINKNKIENERTQWLRSETSEEIRKLLQNKWVPGDIDSQLLAIKHCNVDGHDSFILRYKIGDVFLQFRITQFYVYLALSAEEWKKNSSKLSDTKIFTASTLGLFFNPSLSVQFNQNVETVGDGFLGKGYYDKQPHKFKTIRWWSNGEMILVRISKYYDAVDQTIGGGILPGPSKNWFTQKYKPGTNIPMTKPVLKDK